MTRSLIISKKTVIHYVFFILSIFVITNCGTNSPGLVLSSDCKPPCWFGIEPGKTTENEAISKLKGTSIVEDNSILTHGNKWLIFDDIVYFNLKNKTVTGEVFIINDKTVMIQFSGDLSITFSKAIEEFGEPTYILNIPTYSGPPGGISSNAVIIALIPKIGIEVAYNTKDISTSDRSKLKPENNISLLTYFDSTVYNQLLDAGLFSLGFLNGTETQKYMIPWSGYGDINILYPSAIIDR